MPGTFTTTTRNALRKLTGSSKVSDIDEGFSALADDVDTKMASYSQDTLAKRPAAGRPNALFKATDTGVLQHDTGAGFESLLRLVGTQRGIVNYGEGTGAFSGGGMQVSVTHGLGVVPVFATAVIFDQTANIFYQTHPVGVTSKSATTFGFWWELLVAEPAGGKVAKYLWLAVA